MKSRLDDGKQKQLDRSHRQNISHALMNNRNAAGARSYGGDWYEIVCDDEFSEPLDIETEYYKMQVEDEIKKKSGWWGRCRLFWRSLGREYGKLHPDREKYFKDLPE